MKRLLIFLSIVVIVILVEGCAGQKTTMVKPQESCVPDWYINPPHSQDTIFAVASAQSARLQIAVDKATMRARDNVALETESRVSQLMKSFDEEVGTETTPVILAQFSRVSKHVSSVSLRGSYVVELTICRRGRLFEVYVKVAYPLKNAKAALVEEVKNQQELYTRWRASQGFQELEAELNRMRNSR